MMAARGGDDYSRSPLGDERMIQLLVDGGANLDSRDSMGRTVRMLT